MEQVSHDSIAPPVSSSDELLGEDDCFDILRELEPVAHRWYDVGLALGLRNSTLENFRQSDVYASLRSMIVEWLKMSYNVQKFGKPTWRRIVEAVEATSGGRNPALADALARKYGVMIHVIQPVAHPTPARSINASPEVHTGICCCFTSRVSNNQIRASLRENLVTTGQDTTTENIQLHPRPNGTAEVISHGPSQRTNTSSLLPAIQETSLVQHNVPIAKPQSEGTHQRRSWRFTHSLPDRIEYFEHEESNLIASQKGSRDITVAHPTWQIEDIAQQKGYWGAMTGVAAELRLKRHGGNCYLIRYSERHKHHVISVMRRSGQHSTPVAYHFKLNITKEDGYEIEGTERKFKDISLLLEFYTNNLLTCSKCTIGKPCTPPTPLIN